MKAKRKAAGLTSFLIPKKTIRPTARNIRTRDKSGRTPQVAKEMMHYIIGLLTQSETRWLQTGELRMTTGTPPPPLYNHQRCKLDAILRGTTRSLGWKPVSFWIVKVRFNTKKARKKFTFIQCCAPTNDTKEKIRRFLPPTVQIFLDKTGKKDMTIQGKSRV